MAFHLLSFWGEFCFLCTLKKDFVSLGWLVCAQEPSNLLGHEKYVVHICDEAGDESQQRVIMAVDHGLCIRYRVDTVP